MRHVQQFCSQAQDSRELDSQAWDSGHFALLIPAMRPETGNPRARGAPRDWHRYRGNAG